MDTDPKALFEAVTEEFNAVLQKADILKPSPGMWEKVVKDISQLLGTGMFVEDGLYLRARAYYYSGLYKQAITDIESLLRSPRRDVFFEFPPKRLRAMANIKLGNFSEAEVDLRDEISRLQGVLSQMSICRSDDYYWLLVCKFKGDEKAAMDEQANFF
ncbi:MAG: hypothetical protein ABSB91_04040 [Sedimentisphaerales bacterium]